MVFYIASLPQNKTKRRPSSNSSSIRTYSIHTHYSLFEVYWFKGDFIFGNHAKPKLVVYDFSKILIIACLFEFTGETSTEYLDRVYKNLVENEETCTYETSDFASVSSREFLDIQATIECEFTLKLVRDMIKTCSQSKYVCKNITSYTKLK